MVGAEAEHGELVAVAVLVVAGVGQGGSEAGAEAAGQRAGVLDGWVPAGGGGHLAAPGVVVHTLLLRLGGRTRHPLVSDPGGGEPDLREGPGVVVVPVAGAGPHVAHLGTGVVVDPLLPLGAVGHDGPVQPRLEDVSEGVALTALCRHPPVVSQAEPVGHLDRALDETRPAPGKRQKRYDKIFGVLLYATKKQELHLEKS